jgi:hypothetical protein
MIWIIVVIYLFIVSVFSVTDEDFGMFLKWTGILLIALGLYYTPLIWGYSLILYEIKEFNVFPDYFITDTILTTLSTIIGIPFIIIGRKMSKKVSIKKEILYKEYEEKELKEKIQKEEDEKKRLLDLENKYGIITHHIVYNYFYEFIVFEDSETIILNDNVMPFSEILSYQIRDYVSPYNIPSTSTTKTSTSSMLGRAVVGGVVGGGIGALAGAATAKKTTTIPNNFKRKDFYNLIIKTQDSPLEGIKLKMLDGFVIEKFIEIFDYILEINRQRRKSDIKQNQ